MFRRSKKRLVNSTFAFDQAAASAGDTILVFIPRERPELSYAAIDSWVTSPSIIRLALNRNLAIAQPVLISKKYGGPFTYCQF
jgi:hypothetical protein